MSSNPPKIRPLNGADLKKVYDGGLPHAARGIVATIDDEVVAVAGVTYTAPLQAFSTICDDRLRKYPKTIFLMARKLAEIMGTMNAPVYAIASAEEKNSKAFLERVGFEYYQESQRGSLYVWTR